VNKHARGIAKTEVIKDLPVDTRQGRSTSLLSDDWERTGPIEHPMERDALKPSLGACGVRLGLWVCCNEARNFAFAHCFDGSSFNHKRSIIAE
jgi:hypothetical protein